MSPLLARWLGGALVVLLLVSGAYVQGRSDGRAVTQSGYAKAAKKLDEAVTKVAIAARLSDAQLVAADRARATETRIIDRETIKILDRPVYRNECVDADGVRLIQRAVDAANGRAAAPGRVDGAAAGVRGPAGHD